MEVRGRKRLVYTYAFVFGLECSDMARQRSSTFEDIAVIVSRLPWWAGVGLAIVLYLWLHHVASQPLPAITADPKHMGDAVASQLWRTFALYLQYILPACCLIGAGISGYRQIGPNRPPEISVGAKRSASARNAGGPEIHSRLDERSTPDCPTCGASMVRRVAKKGGNAGEAFWGCTRFPQCRGTRPGA